MKKFHPMFDYYAFISYSSKDAKWGKRLQRRLEHYRMPSTLCSERGWERTPIKPVFFAPYDIQPGGLDEELQDRLRRSKNLIVICSPHSARSRWVGREIEYFHSLGRWKNIFFFIIDGSPHSADSARECINPVVDSLEMPELLGVNIHEAFSRWPWINRERAYVQLITKLLDVEFDSVWRRHIRRRRVRAISMAAAGVLGGAALYLFAVPVGVTVSVAPEQSGLPAPEDVVLTIGGGEYTAPMADPRFANIRLPGYKRFGHIDIALSARFFTPVDTSVATGYGLRRDISLALRRDSSFAIYGGEVVDADLVPVEGAVVEVAGFRAITSAAGVFKIVIPLERQRPEQSLSITKPGYRPVNRTNEAPGSMLRFIIRRAD